MLVYVETPRVVTRKVFRDKEQAARFIARNASSFVKVIHQYGRVVVLYRTHVAQPKWSRNREESAKARPTFKVAPQNWPKQYS
jgi:hypothetical protein